MASYFVTLCTTLLARVQLLSRPQFSVPHIFIHSSGDDVDILHTTSKWIKSQYLAKLLQEKLYSCPNYRGKFFSLFMT